MSNNLQINVKDAFSFSRWMSVVGSRPFPFPPLDHILLDTVPQQAKQYIKNIQKFDTLRLNIHIYNSNILDWFVQAPTMTQ